MSLLNAVTLQCIRWNAKCNILAEVLTV